MKQACRWADLTDLVVPRLEGSTRAREVSAKRHWRRLASLDQEAIEQLGSNEERLGQYTAEIDKLLEREQSRVQSVEGRLTSIVGLTSIAATIVLGGLVSLAAGTLVTPPGPVTWASALGGLYLVLQLVVGLVSAINGLSRAAHLADTASDLFGAQHSAPAVRLRTGIVRKLDHLRDHRRHADAKVDHLAVAHRAIKNFLVGLLLLAAGAAWLAVTRDSSPGIKPDSLRGEGSGTSVSASSASRPSATIPTSAAMKPVAVGTTAALLMLAGGLALVVTGAVFLAAGKPVRRIGLGAALLTGGSLLSLFGGSKLELQIDKLIGELHLSYSEKAASAPPVLPARAMIKRIVTIGPFPDGDHVLPREAVVKCLRERLTSEFISEVGGWQIVGRVDKRPLKADRATVYGSNQALAMSRANWVRDQALVHLPGFDDSASVVSVGGAGRIGARVGVPELQSDRMVDVYVLVMQSVAMDSPVIHRPAQLPSCPG